MGTQPCRNPISKLNTISCAAALSRTLLFVQSSNEYCYRHARMPFCAKYGQVKLAKHNYWNGYFNDDDDKEELMCPATPPLGEILIHLPLNFFFLTISHNKTVCDKIGELWSEYNFKATNRENFVTIWLCQRRRHHHRHVIHCCHHSYATVQHYKECVCLN